MDTLKDQFGELRTLWSAVYEKISAQPETWKPYLPYSSPEEVNEVILTLCHWLERLRAPEGFAPVYRLAKSLIGSSLNNTLSSLKSIDKGEYPHFPTFLTGLNQMLSALHSMSVFANKDEIRDASVSMGGQLAEAISLMGTAQRELKDKLDLLNKSNEVAKETETQIEKINSFHDAAKTASESVAKIHTDAKESLGKIEGFEKTIASSEQEIGRLLKASTELQVRIAKQEALLGKLHEKNIEQQQLIDDLLPKGASAGLAAAFGHRAAKLETTKWVWLALFISSIIALALWAFKIIDRPVQPDLELWKLILQRLPLAAPFVWIGWFSAVQYGNTIRVQEDYAFKEATSKAFAGYRDHMEHMANVKLEEANTAMTLLAEKTVSILANEPLRIYNRAERDASPANGFFSSFGAGKNKKTENE